MTNYRTNRRSPKPSVQMQIGCGLPIFLILLGIAALVMAVHFASRP